MQPVESCLHCQFLCSILKALFYQTSSEINIFLQKNAKFLSAGGSAPRPLLRISRLCAWLQHIRIFEVLCLKFLLTPPPKFSGSATARSLRLLQSLEVQLTNRILIFFSGGI